MWVYEQASGRLIGPDGKLVAAGYAGGNEGKNPEGKNNPDMQDKRSIGPLPRGIYTLGTPVLKSHLGPFAIPLIPAPDNKMCGRGSFYVHGDRTRDPGNASQGCMILPRAVRDLMWASDDHELKVVSQ